MMPPEHHSTAGFDLLSRQLIHVFHLPTEKGLERGWHGKEIMREYYGIPQL